MEDTKLPDFEAHLKKIFHARLYLLFWVGITLFPLFMIHDYYIAYEHFNSFSIYRIIVCSIFLILLFVRSLPFGRKHPFAISMVGLVCCGLATSIMTVKTGGYNSFFYVGMICVFVAFSFVLPINFYQSVFAGIAMYLIYVIPVFIFSSANPGDGMIFFNNNFFFLFFIVVSAVKSFEDYNARKLEFKLRNDLDYYAGNLEQEVKRRIQLFEESEIRYKELYNNILDSLIVMDSAGKVLTVNPNFYSVIGEETDDFYFIDLVHTDDRQYVKHQMLEKLFQQAEIRDFQFRMVTKKSKVVYMECNGKALQTIKGTIGYQLVLRDISFRKKLEYELIASLSSLENTRAVTIMGLAKLTEYRDGVTGSHLERIQEYARLLAVELSKLPEYAEYVTQDYIEALYLSAILHDIGKVGIPDAILLKPEKLDESEFNMIKNHCKYGGDAIKAVESKIEGDSFLTLGREIAYYHHEKWDGTGYPNGFEGEQIPLSARIIAVSDVYDALTTQRAYKKAYSHLKATEIIKSESGKHFDPKVVKAFLATEAEFEQIHKDLTD